MPVAALSLRGVRTRDRAVIAAVAAALSVAPIAAGAAKPATPRLDAKRLWATVDVCNTASHPDTIGVRGSMPGTGDRHESMFMSFIVEYRSSSGHWHYFGSGGQSHYVAVGDASATARQAGQDFQLDPAHLTSTQMLRGVVLFQWRLHGKVVASTVRSTSAGHAPAAGSDPPGFSAAFCRIQPNSRGSLVITPVTPSAARRSTSARRLTVHT